MENDRSPTSTSCHNLLMDAPGYIKPELQDFLLTDITAEELLKVANTLDVKYLSFAESFPGLFPVTGEIFGVNKRLMVNLVCRRRDNSSQPLNIIFLVDTGCPCSYLSAKAMEALVGDPCSNIGTTLPVMIHSDIVIECNLSPLHSHFADVNVLGADFLAQNTLTLTANYRNSVCSLSH